MTSTQGASFGSVQRRLSRRQQMRRGAPLLLREAGENPARARRCDRGRASKHSTGCPAAGKDRRSRDPGARRPALCHTTRSSSGTEKRYPPCPAPPSAAPHVRTATAAPRVACWLPSHCVSRPSCQPRRNPPSLISRPWAPPCQRRVRATTTAQTGRGTSPRKARISRTATRRASGRPSRTRSTAIR